MPARDRETGRQLTIRAAMTVNAAGARAGEVAAMFGARPAVPLLAAMNLVTSVPAKEVALAAPTAAGRMLTLVPWKGHSIVGTAHATEEKHSTPQQKHRRNTVGPRPPTSTRSSGKPTRPSPLSV